MSDKYFLSIINYMDHYFTLIVHVHKSTSNKIECTINLVCL